jgi:hypothetical protein
MVAKKGVKFNEIFEKGFIEAYIGDINRPEFDDNILILREESYVDLDRSKYSAECLCTYYIDDGSYKDNVYVYKIPIERMDDYGKFIQGKINEFSEEYKKHLIQFWDTKEDSLFYGVLYSNTDIILNKLNKINEKRDPWNKINILSINKSLYTSGNDFRINIDLNNEILGLKGDE